jgi:putative ABC transport system substrate-binding protein
MRRRDFISLMAGSGVAWSASAQPNKRLPLIGWLGGSSAQVGGRNHKAFLEGLQHQGLEDGKTFTLVTRWADGNTARLSTLAKDILALDPDVVLSASGAGNVALMHASATVPIVGALTIDPIGVGLAVAHNRPGRNFTGVLLTIEGLPSKQAEILIELMPYTRVVGVLANPDNPTHARLIDELRTTLGARSIAVEAVLARKPDELGSQFEILSRKGVEGIVVLTDNLSFTSASQINSLAAAARIPTIVDRREHVAQGGLISYGISIPANFRRAAYFVDRILKGAKPGDLPLEFPTKVELVINLKTAKALGLTVPPTLLARADEVIE